MCPVTLCFTFTTAMGTGPGTGTAGPALFKFMGLEVGNAEPRSVGRPGSQDSAASKLRVGAEEHTGEKALIPTLTCLLSPALKKSKSNKRLARKAASCPCDPVGTIPRQPPPAMLACAWSHTGVCLPPCWCAPLLQFLTPHC